MARHSDARAVKCLNNSSGRRRFVFKTFSQRLEEIDIDVYRSLDCPKAEPSEGSTFFRDCLMEYRELNTAEDFMSLYEEVFSLVQTLPLIILRKEFIINSLLSRLKIEARLSLEPILRLIAALSKDLLGDFVPDLERIADSLECLLFSGADRDTEIIEQIFTSWSLMMMHLQKYLLADFDYILRITKKLRYYPKDYVREFMAESMSFLFRKAPIQTLNEVILKLLNEVVMETSEIGESAAGILISHSMRITLSTLHWKAETTIPLLLDSSSFNVGDQNEVGSKVVLRVLVVAFNRLCAELNSVGITFLFNCLCERIRDYMEDQNPTHLTDLLSLLLSIVQDNHPLKFCDIGSIVDTVNMLVENCVLPCVNMPSPSIDIHATDKVLKLIACFLNGLPVSKKLIFAQCVTSKWESLFYLRTKSLLVFVEDLLAKDPFPFRRHITIAFSNLIEIYTIDVLHVMINFIDKLEGTNSAFLDLDIKEEVSRLYIFLEKTLHYFISKISDAAGFKSPGIPFQENEFPSLWAAVVCLPHFLEAQIGPSVLMDLMHAIQQLLMVDMDTLGFTRDGFTRDAWKNLIGATLSSYHKSISTRNMHYEGSEITKFLDLAKIHKFSPKILSAVADILDSTSVSSVLTEKNGQFYLPDYVAGKTSDALKIFEDNLFHANKEIRLSTLRILCHYAPISCNNEKQMDYPKETVSGANHVFVHLWSVEKIENISIQTSSGAILLISKIQTALNAHSIDEESLPAVLGGIIGIFNNRFSLLWGPALECLSVLVSQHSEVVWDRYIKCLEYWQTAFLSHSSEGNNPSEDAGLIGHCKLNLLPQSESTSSGTVLANLIQCLMKVPKIVESRNRNIISLFLKFLGNNEDTTKRGKEWKTALKEWLSLFQLLENPRAFYQGHALKDALLYRLLDQNDADIQLKVFDCLINWRDDFLLPYVDNMRNLIDAKSMRDELTKWDLCRNSIHSIDVMHRTHVVPIIIRILMPKVRNLKMISNQKGGGPNHRRAVLGFLAQLEVGELSLFFELMFKPLQTSEVAEACKVDASEILKPFTADMMSGRSWKKGWGFLHVVEDIIAVFDESHLAPFLVLLMNCVVQMLAVCTQNDIGLGCSGSSSEKNSPYSDLDGVSKDEVKDEIMDKNVVKQFKAFRSLCLKIISLVLNKYDDHEFGVTFWDIFFNSVRHLTAKLKQEGASGQNPSALFHCFLAMSKSYKLVPLLSRQDNLVADIFSLLTVPSASESIFSSVLKFVGNLLELDGELDGNENLRNIILPNVDVLVSSLSSLFSLGSATKRKLPEITELPIFSLLPKYIKEPSTAERFLNTLLPVLKKSHKNPDACVKTMVIIREVVVLLGCASTKNFLHSVTPLLIKASFAFRNSICDVLDAVAANDSSVLILATVLRELNATSDVDIGDLDYEGILGAYEKINMEFFYTIQEEHALPILALSINDMTSEELILRQSALRLLTSFIDFLAENLQESGNFDNAWSKASIERIVKKFFLKHMGNAMSMGGVARKLWIDLLKQMVLKLPSVANLGSFSALCSADAEQDIFNNIVHLQKHRMAKAVRRFQDIVSSGKLSQGITNKVFVPLLFSMLYEAQDGKDEHIRSACVDALASISDFMDWNQYYILLNRCFRDLKLKTHKQKILLRLICGILDHFHFLGSSSVHGDGNSASDSASLSSSLTLSRCPGSSDVLQIQLLLQKKLLPKLQKLLSSDSDNVNVNISLVALKVLKLLPSEIMDMQLPSIIHRISNLLRHRLESIRDDARSALAACLKELGLEYFQFVLKVLTGTLKRGFELHVLGYTLNFLLSKLLVNQVCGKLDYCIDDILSIVEKDILGEVSEEKDVEKIASKMKETRKHKSYETLKLISQSVTFKNNALKLLSPVTAHLRKELTSKVKSRVEKMLNHIAAGIQCNPSANQTDLFIFVHCLIKDGLGIEGHKHEHPHVTRTSKLDVDNEGVENSSNGLIFVDRRFSHLITAFALGLLQSYMSNLKLNREDEQLLSLLDPFVCLLVQCLESKYESIVSAAVRCLTVFLRMRLPSFQSQSDKIKKSLLVIAQGSRNDGSELTEPCMKFLAALLRGTKVTLSTDQLRMLIQLPLFLDLAKSPSFVALKLLKAIVQRKLVVPEIYDIIQIISELMVQCQFEAIRKKCSQILLQFLLGYQLSEKRLQQHLQFLLSNLRYEHSAGREAVLEMLHAILLKFPGNVVDAQSQIIFVHLVACLANDDNSKVRSMTAAAIKCLMGHVSSHSLQSILEYSLCWYASSKQNLVATSAQVLGFLVEVMGKGFKKHLQKVLPLLKAILKSAASHHSSSEEDSSNNTVPFWKEAYYSLVMLEKILQQFNGMILDVENVDLWETICDFHLHPHLWLRSISNRIYLIYVAAVADACGGKSELSLEKYILMKPSTLFLSSASFSAQLKVPQTDERAGDIICQNLVFSICGLDTVLRRNDCKELPKFWSNLDSSDKGRFRKAFGILDHRKGRSMLDSFICNHDAQHTQYSHPFVSYLLQRMGKLFFQMEANQMKIIFKCFKSISSRLLVASTSDNADVHDYAYHILLPVYKVCEGFSGKVIPDDVKQEAQEVSDKVNETMGVQRFVQIYSQIKKIVQTKREKRKQGEKVMAVVNPVRHAKRKLKHAAKRNDHKRRKRNEMRIAKWLH